MLQRLRLASLCLLLTCASRSALALPDGDEPGGARTGAPALVAPTRTPTVARPGTHCGPDADGLYEEGFDMMAMGERAEASLRMARVLELCPSHPHAAEVKRLAETAREFVSGAEGDFRPAPRRTEKRADEDPTLDALLPTRVEADLGLRAPEAPSLLARGELVTLQTLHGLVEGLLVCGALDCDDARVAVTLSFAGVALGGGASFFLSENIRPGQALAVNSGMGWGFWNALALTNVADAEGEKAFGIVIGGGLLGTAVGSAIAVFGKPRSGQVSLANSSGLWAGTLAMWLMDFAELELFEKTFFEVELVATNVGLGVGALLARAFPMSRGRVLLIDAGGIVGLLLGVGTAVLIDSEPSARLTGGLGFLGTVAGLASISYFSRGLDEPEAPQGMALVPMGPRGSYGASVFLSF